MITISVRMLKNRPKIPQPNGFRPFTPAMAAQNETRGFDVVASREHDTVQHVCLLVSGPDRSSHSEPALTSDPNA